MLWRARNRPGKVAGSWTGPLRLLLQEGGTGGTLWLATGSTLVRARTTQVRRCSKQEELDALLEGTAILSTPTTIDSFMQHFTGKHYVNATGEVLSQHQLQDNVQGADILQTPSQDHRPDEWRIEEDSSGRWLVRTHHLPRLTMFIPSRTQDCPFVEEDVTGKRITKLTMIGHDTQPLTIEDNYKEVPQRQFQERWKGQTRFQIRVRAKRTHASCSKGTSAEEEGKVCRFRSA